MRIALVGARAFGEKHLDGLKNIPGVVLAASEHLDREYETIITTQSAR